MIPRQGKKNLAGKRWVESFQAVASFRPNLRLLSAIEGCDFFAKMLAVTFRFRNWRDFFIALVKEDLI